MVEHHGHDASRRESRVPEAGSTALLPLVVAFVLLWNSGFIGAEVALPDSGPLTLLFWRYLALSALLAAWTVARRRSLWPGSRGAVQAAVTGILAHGVWLGCVLVALQRGVPAGIVALVVALQPLVTGALSGPVTGERTSGRQWAGLVLGLAGVLVAVVARMEAAGAAPAWSYLLPFLSVVAITAATLLQRRLELRASQPPPPLALQLLYQSAATCLVLAPPAILIEGLQTRWTLAYVGAMVWLVIAVSLGAYGAMWRLLARMDATRVASLFFLGPPVTMAMAWVAFGDTLRATDVAGLVIAGGGAGLVHARQRAPDRGPQVEARDTRRH